MTEMPASPPAAPRRTPIIASSLIELQNGRLAAHRSKPTIARLGPRPWEGIPADADALFTYQSQWGPAPRVAPAGWPYALRWIQVASAGLDTFPPWFFEGPVVTRGRGVQAPAMAEYVIAAIFAHEKQFWDVRVTSAETWKHRILGGVAGKTVGIAGFGAIGELVAKSALALGMTVKAITRSRPVAMGEVEVLPGLKELMAASDHLVLALPLTEETRGSVNAKMLASAKPGLHLINVARGPLIDQEALVAALDAGNIAAATLDVATPEPLPPGHPFYSHPAIRLTPHVSGMSEDNEDRLAARLLDNLDRFLEGKPVPGIVDPVRRY